jgi:hypothetical protein
MGHIVEKCIKDIPAKEAVRKISKGKESILDLKLFSKEEWSKIKAPYVNTF